MSCVRGPYSSSRLEVRLTLTVDRIVGKKLAKPTATVHRHVKDVKKMYVEGRVMILKLVSCVSAKKAYQSSYLMNA